MERLELNQARNFVASMNFLQLLCFILVGAVVLDPDRQQAEQGERDEDDEAVVHPGDALQEPRAL